VRTGHEVADVFRAAGPAYRTAHAGHLSLHQLKVMSAIEHCRTAALGGHVEACTDCGHWRIAYNSCRNRHCPKCQGAAARTWLEAREADLLPVGYFHVVFTLPAEIAAIAFTNKAMVYDLLFKAAAETMLTIAADPQHLGARIGITAVLHTWGSRWRYRARWEALDLLAARFPAASAGARCAVPAAVPREASPAPRCRPPCLFRQTR
jgi:hypothetical protein